MQKRLTILAAVLISLAATGCIRGLGGRSYVMPLTTAEAPLLFPAIASTAEGMGLAADQGVNRVEVTLEDGSTLSWVAEPARFALWLNPTETPPEQAEAKYRSLKVKADQIWELAIEARQKNNVGATVMLNPPAETQHREPPRPAGSFGMNSSTTDNDQSSNSSRMKLRGQAATRAPGRSNDGCRSGIDCGSGEFCKDRGDGVKVCMGNGGAGAYCRSGIDCGSGLWCRGDGVKVCAE
jgi:hypothetical protein